VENQFRYGEDMSSESLFTQCKGCNKSVLKSEKKCPDCGKRISKLSVIHWIGIFILAILIIGVINSPKKENNQKANIEKISLEENVQLDYSWTKEAFDSVMEADFIITNNNSLDIKDIQIECNHYSKSGTEIDSNNRTIYEIIERGKSKQYPNFNMGFMHSQAVKSSCYVKKVTEFK
jgi:RNA polymerase subunit RPABC4/transcription elongation factor Spt4